MLSWSHDATTLRVSSPRYTLIWAQDRPFVYLDMPHGKRLAELFVLSSVHSTRAQDDTTAIDAWQLHESGAEVTLTLNTRSTAWEHKQIIFECGPDRLRYRVAVEGQGALTDVHYFGGYYSGHVRWGSGFFWSGQNFAQLFNPEPSSSEVYLLPACSGSVIGMTGVPLPGRADWFFTPPPFCFAFDTGDNTWLGAGVEGSPGENRFTEFRYQGQPGAFYMTLSYEGHTVVNGRCELPAIGFDFAASPYEAVQQHAAALRQQGLVPDPDAVRHPDWWHTPIYCGWGSQCYRAGLEKGRAPDYARQELYETFMATLEAHRLHPGIVVLDDKWQATYGDNRVDMQKWPDIRQFVDQRHLAGQRVLLWLKAWDPEGIPADECVTNAAGLPVAVDPTHPAFERRLRESVRVMLGADGYDADGFKIDFTARIPNGPGLKLYGDAWGLELMRCYLAIIHDEAHRVKPDALVMTHTPHPYLADVVDMIRLNDINTGKDVLRAMTHRAKIAAIACPNAVIDTDNWPITDKASWRDYIRLQPALGVPSLYYVSHIDSTGEPLDEDDYALIRAVWDEYRSKWEGRHA